MEIKEIPGLGIHRQTAVLPPADAPLGAPGEEFPQQHRVELVRQDGVGVDGPVSQGVGPTAQMGDDAVGGAAQTEPVFRRQGSAIIHALPSSYNKFES